MCRSWRQLCTKEPGAWVQPFKAFVLTALQKDRVRVALVSMMPQICKLEDQPTEVGRWRKLELTSATAGTLKSGLPARLQMHLSLRLDKRYSADQPLTALDELSAS